MEIVLLVVRLSLAAVFILALAGKAFAFTDAQQTLVSFGVPQRLSRFATVLLLASEAVVGLLLIPSSTAWWGAIGAFALLLAFTIAVTVTILRGRRPDCRCFGQVHSAPVGKSTVIRNLLLMGFTALIVSRGPQDAGSSIGGLISRGSRFEIAIVSVITVITVIVVLQSMIIMYLLKRYGDLLIQIDQSGLSSQQNIPQGLPIGSKAPEFMLSDLQGIPISLRSLLDRGRPLLLFFSHAGCEPCQTLLSDVGKWHREMSGAASIVILGSGKIELQDTHSELSGVADVLYEPNNNVSEAYRIVGTPAAVVVEPDGTIGSSVAVGPDPVRYLVRSLAGRFQSQV